MYVTLQRNVHAEDVSTRSLPKNFVSSDYGLLTQCNYSQLFAYIAKGRENILEMWFVYV